MKYLWLLVTIFAVTAGTISGEVSRKVSYGWVDSKSASLQVLGDGSSDLRCSDGRCRVCFEPLAVPQLRDTICRSTPGAMVLQPFSASAVTALLLLAFWVFSRRAGLSPRRATPESTKTERPTRIRKAD